MGEQNSMASQNKLKKPNRKASKKISFRVSESKYLKLSLTAQVLNISVAAFAKKKAQRARVVTPKIEAEQVEELKYELNRMVNGLGEVWRQLT